MGTMESAHRNLLHCQEGEETPPFGYRDAEMHEALTAQ